MMWNFKEYKDSICLIADDGTEVSYQQMDEYGEELANAVGKRALVFSFCSNTIGSVLGYTSFLNHKIVPLLLNSHLDDELRENLLDCYHPEFIWAPDEISSHFDGLEVKYQKYGYSLYQTNYGESISLYPDLALLLTTSGSTGSPKLVRQSYENIKCNTESIVAYLELDATERPITTLPMNYTYGLSIINTHLWVGSTILLTDSTLMQKEFWHFFKEQKATSFGGVPYTYEILDKLRFFRMDLPSLRTMTQAGGKLSPELHKKFAEYAKEHNKHFVVMYGQCEATARMAYLPHERALDKYGSMGIAIPGGKLCLMDVDGKLIEESDVTGELVYKGANVTLGYAECKEDLSKGDERDGVLETGDMAKKDEDGFFYIVGRKKRFLKIYGNRVNLDEIDRLLKEEFNYIDCTCAGVDDHMYIFITDEKIQNEVKEFVVNKTGLNHVAFQVVVIDEIPKNDAGKTLYRELEKYYQK